MAAPPPVLLRPVGFWTTRKGDGLPDPRLIQSTTWEKGRRDVIAAYLKGCAVLAEENELHECLICGNAAGYRERTDGAWRWPEGLAHYVFEHGVRVPPELLELMERHGFRPPKVDVKSLREQQAPRDPTATNLMSGDVARDALDDLLQPRKPPSPPRAAPTKAPPKSGVPARPELEDATEAIPVAQAWTVKVQGVPTKTPSVPFDRPLVLGRDHTCDVVLEHRSVSRRHVRLVPWRDRVIAQDLGSSNGLVHRGVQQQGQVELKSGEQLSLGQATITLVRDASQR